MNSGRYHETETSGVAIRFIRKCWQTLNPPGRVPACEGAPSRRHFLLDEIRRHPGEITLNAIAPLTSLGAAIERNPATFAS
jgi:inosine-uridine nucleoside N-ribohydrolase